MKESGPLTLIIFGASGDLTARKLVPSLYRLQRKGRLPADLTIVGVSRSDLGNDGFRKRMEEAVREHASKQWSDDAWSEFSKRLFYEAGDATKIEDVQAFGEWLQKHENNEEGRRLYYLSVSPKLYESIITNLGNAGMSQQNGGWRRMIIEKPFGTDLASAQKLNKLVADHFEEKQLYRIDHYLGKDTVQNILVLRFANSLFEPIWNNKYLDHVQITVCESVTVEGRGGYYDKAGVLRDMFQNHLLQLLTLIAMEAPARYTATSLRDEKVKVLDSITPLSVEEAGQALVCGQYEGYREEKGVDPNSHTPTYAALRLHIDNWRWNGVPFYLRSGKGMPQRYSEVVVQFRCPPHLMFPMKQGEQLDANQMKIRLQPDEGIQVMFQTKIPDQEGMKMQTSELEFEFSDHENSAPIPEAYERLLLDALNGDAALFMRNDEIERAWEIIEPFIRASEEENGSPFETYAVGSEGPECAKKFLEQESRCWASFGANE